MPAHRQTAPDATLEPATHDQRCYCTEHGGKQQTAREQTKAFRDPAGQTGTHLVPDRGRGGRPPFLNVRVAL